MTLSAAAPAFAFAIAATAASGATARRLEIPYSDNLAFEDNFDELNMKNWKHEITLGGGGNWEFQGYLNNRSNSYVDDGNLYLRPTLTSDIIGVENVEGNNFLWDLWGSSPADMCTGNQFYGCERMAGGGGNPLNPVTSARVRTAETFQFKYGKVEIRAKMPKGDWLWPAVWMMPANNAYGQWPASGEIDIIESRGNARGTSTQAGVEHVGSTLHWGPIFEENQFEQTSVDYTLPSGDFNEDFHVFGLVWGEEGLYTYVNDEENRVLEVDFREQSMWERGGWTDSPYDNVWEGRGNGAPFDQHYYLILNLAVGGTTGFFEDGGNKPWSNDSPNSPKEFWEARDSWLPTWDYSAVGGRKDPQSAMAIDYVRVWSDDVIFPGAGGAPLAPTPSPPTLPPTPEPPTLPPTPQPPTLAPTSSPPTAPPTTPPPTSPPTVEGCPVPGSGLNNGCCLDCPSNRACVSNGGCYSDDNADECAGGACPAYVALSLA